MHAVLNGMMRSNFDAKHTRANMLIFLMYKNLILRNCFIFKTKSKARIEYIEIQPVFMFHI